MSERRREIEAVLDRLHAFAGGRGSRLEVVIARVADAAATQEAADRARGATQRRLLDEVDEHLRAAGRGLVDARVALVGIGDDLATIRRR